MPLDGNAADFDNDAAADGDLVIGEDGGGLVRAVGVLVMSEPAGKLEIAELADDLETVVQCGSSLEREKEADVLVNGSHGSANVDGVLVSAVVKLAAGDLASVFAVNSGYALNESGPSLSWTSLCQIFLW